MSGIFPALLGRIIFKLVTHFIRITYYYRSHSTSAAEFSAPRQHCPKGRPSARNVLIENSVEAESFEPESRAIHPVIRAGVPEQGCGSGSRRSKMTHKSRNFFLSSGFEVLDGLF
jgi:hypothetical protein